MRINGLNQIGSALENMLTHMNRSVCVTETAYPQTKGLAGIRGDSIRQEARGWLLEA